MAGYNETVKFIIAIAFVISLTLGSYPATYKGKSIDGKKYAAVVTNNDGELVSADVRFEGLIVYLYFEKWIHRVYLAKQAIDDPLNIAANDGHHAWKISLRDKLD